MPSVVIVTYRSADVIEACLRTLLASDVALEVVVVDNDSQDGGADLAARYDSVKVIRNHENRGFAAAVSQGVAATREDPIILLNPDTEVTSDCVRRLVETLQDDAVAIVGCKVLDGDGGTIQHVGGVVGPNALTDHIGRGDIDRGQHDERRDVSYVTGAGLAIRRSVWDLLGGFDPGYWPAYFEECELCWRARAAGFRVIVEPAAVMRHHEAASTRGDEEALSESFYHAYHRNRLRFVLRNYSFADLFTKFVPAELRWMRARNHRGQASSLRHAYSAAVRDLPALLRHRWRRSDVERSSDSD